MMLSQCFENVAGGMILALGHSAMQQLILTHLVSEIRAILVCRVHCRHTRAPMETSKRLEHGRETYEQLSLTAQCR